MDPLTHTLTGAALSRAGFHRATPLATATLILAANAPDIDIAAVCWGSYATVAFRRGVTHGPIALLLLPVLLTLLMLGWDRWVRRRRDPSATPANGPALFLLALLGTATHPLLDWMNSYGIRLLSPFSEKWFYGDALFIVDPWLWLVLGGAVYLSGTLAREHGAGSGEPGAHLGRSRWGDLGWGILALLTTLIVLGVTFVPTAAKVVWVLVIAAIVAMRLLAGRVERAPWSSERIARWGLGLGIAHITMMVVASASAEREVRRTLIAEGFTPVEVMIEPEPANPFRSSILATSSTSYIRGSYQWLARPRVRLAREPVPFPPRSAATEAASESLAARRFLTWSRFPVYFVDELEDGYLVWIRDLRFMGEREGELNGVRVRLDRELRVVE